MKLLSPRPSISNIIKSLRFVDPLVRRQGIARFKRIGYRWNNARHLEIYFAVPCMGAVLHPINLRLPGDQIAFIANHAEDLVLFVDASLLPAVEKLAPHLKGVKHFVVMGDTPRGQRSARSTRTRNC